MVGVRLPEQLEMRLNHLVDQTHRPKSYYIKLALEEFLDEQEDLLIAESRWTQIELGKHKLIPLEDVMKELEASDAQNVDH